jgi:hypothetical protein
MLSFEAALAFGSGFGFWVPAAAPIASWPGGPYSRSLILSPASTMGFGGFPPDSLPAGEGLQSTAGRTPAVRPGTWRGQ